MDYDVADTISLRCTAVDTQEALCLRQEIGEIGLLEALEAPRGAQRSPGHQIYDATAPSKRDFRRSHVQAGR